MARERTFRSESIILRRSDFGEADRRLVLYTYDFGKIQAIAKGARKPQSRKTGHVELFMRSKCLFARGRDLNVLTQAEMVDGYAALREDLIKATYASYAVELLDRFTVEEDKNTQLYDLLANTLTWLTLDAEVLLVARFYELRLLSITGFQPRLFHCVSCGESIEDQDQFFSAELGGLLCPDCRLNDRRALPVTAVAVKVLRYLQTRPWQTVKHLQLKPTLLHEIETILHHYLTHILERNLKSVDFLRRLRQESTLFTQPDTNFENGT